MHHMEYCLTFELNHLLGSGYYQDCDGEYDNVSVDYEGNQSSFTGDDNERKMIWLMIIADDVWSVLCFNGDYFGNSGSCYYW